MKKLLLAGACLVLLVGCDYTVPLVKAPDQAIDAKVLGLWEQVETGAQTNRLLVLPFGAREYMVAFPLAAKDGLFAKACLCRCAGRTFVQLQWIGTAKGGLAEDSRVYQFAAYESEGEGLRVRLLDPAVVSKDITSSSDLAKAIKKNKDNPELFRDPMVFRKVKTAE